MIPILHHYATSPFAELARVALGLKGLDWQSVIIPNMMPKPDLVELTGGYARTPVLQIGADVYCDTAAILDGLEALRPTPSFYPAPLGPLHRMVAGWAGAAQFGAHVGAAMRNMPAAALAPGFTEDRKSRFGFDFEQMPKAAPHLETQVFTAAAWLEAILADGRAFIGGDAAGHGDLALYSNLWFVTAMPFARDTAAKLMAHGRLAAWFGRVQAFNRPASAELTGTDAIAAARPAEPLPATGSIDDGFTSGQPVLIKTENSGDAPVSGRLLRCDATGITIARGSDVAGLVSVHFPRIGQIVLPG